MIKCIQSIKHLGIFDNYSKKNNLQPFTQKNLIYGWNYSGKTTLSRLFSFIENHNIPEEFSNVEFEIKMWNGTTISHTNIADCHILARVFNTDFIKNSLNFDSVDKKIKGIKFDVGENTAIRELINANNGEIENAKNKIRNNHINIDKFNEFENSKFTNEARRIKNECLNSIIEFNKTHFKNVISSFPPKCDINQYIITDIKLLNSIRSSAVATQSKELIDVPFPILKYDTILQAVKNILASEPTLTQTDDILSNYTDLYLWAKSGLTLHTTSQLTKCAFCGADISNGERLNFLNKFFSNQAALLKEQILELKNKISEEIESFNSLIWLRISRNDIVDGLSDTFSDYMQEYQSLRIRYTTLLELLLSILQDKEDNNLFISKTLPSNYDDTCIEDIIDWFKKVEQLLIQHNNTVNKFESTRKQAQLKFKQHLVASFLKKEQYYTIKSAKEKEEIIINTATQLIKHKQEENIQLSAQLKSITAGQEKLNKFIKKFLNREDIQINVIEDDFFVLKRGETYAKNLSEGEKMAIAFAHFIVSLDSLKTEGTLKDYIIFIDDPISSLDANHIAQVASLINNFFFAKGLDPAHPDKILSTVKQLFISTHNFEFFSFIKNSKFIKHSTRIEYEDGQTLPKGLDCFLLKRISANKSELDVLPTTLMLYKSEYIYLFSEIYTFYENGCPADFNTLIPNIIRRFLEMYTLTRLPGSCGEIDDRISELVGGINEIKILHQFSHLNELDRIGKHSELILRISDIINEVFLLLEKDITHYQSLLEAIHKPAIQRNRL